MHQEVTENPPTFVPTSRPTPPPSTAKRDVNYYKKVEHAKKLVKNCIKDPSTHPHAI